ncbi:DUF805 domain-containing protein [Winogradskyella bathintestinalis]|uniref:DUF805 domain-containing protein n=1 Tax=Winogradskyella bathintestinalis TaxID=3035208 RepID=A0ABT7ZZ68_9FLAO|nr:DUF805 domain-containing protein [Winogradskyella bathintestinalis]MDN3494279.1 DUF805 domain-containing protein [Winogradskyella bathintestinalis]
MKYFIKALRKWNDFSGKTDLKSFWMFFLFFSLSAIPIGIIRALTGFEHLFTIYSTIMLIPYAAIGFRRLNDAGLNRFLFLIPFVNLILAVFPSKFETELE